MNLWMNEWTYTLAVKWGIHFSEQIYVWCLPFQSCLCAADSLNYPEERRQLWFEACLVYRIILKGFHAALTMLLWCALVISNILPTRSVVETPWVLLHSLRRRKVPDTGCPASLLFLFSAHSPQRNSNKLTCTSPTSSPPHMCLFHPRLVLYHLKPQQKKPHETLLVSENGIQKQWPCRTVGLGLKSLNHDALYLRAHRSHNCTCPGSPGWWRKAPLPRPHPPI